MAFFDDFSNAIEAYAGDHIDVKLVAFQQLRGGTVLNPGEWFRCQVQVINNGHLNLKGVTVSISSTPFAAVSLGGGPTSIVFLPFAGVAAHSSAQSGAWVYGFATAPTGGPKDVITARIAGWDADLNDLLNQHNRFGPVEGRINVEVFPG